MSKRPELEPHGGHVAELPEALLHKIMSQLSARDLAALSVQDVYLRIAAGDSALWEPLALARWPGASAAASAHYAGDMHRLYLARAPLPHAFPLAADRIRTVTGAQQQQQAGTQPGAAGAVSGGFGGSRGSGPVAAVAAAALPQLAFEDVMRQTFAAGLACTRDRAVKRTAEWRGVKADLTWWATQRPEVVVAFIRSTHDILGGHGHSAGGGHGWNISAARGGADAPWRRSSVAFLQELGLLTGAHASVVNRIAAEAATLDRAIRSVQQRAESGAVAVPEGIPSTHWWFH